MIYPEMVKAIKGSTAKSADSAEALNCKIDADGMSKNLSRVSFAAFLCKSTLTFNCDCIHWFTAELCSFMSKVDVGGD